MISIEVAGVVAILLCSIGALVISRNRNKKGSKKKDSNLKDENEK